MIYSLRKEKNLYKEKNTDFNYNNDLIKYIKRIIDENINKKITLPYLSDITGYSVSYISKFFKKNTGKTIIDYILEKRIEKAKEYILEGKRSFSEISSMLGFKTLQYFSIQFKQQTNMTPSQYDKSIKLAK